MLVKNVISKIEELEKDLEMYQNLYTKLDKVKNYDERKWIESKINLCKNEITKIKNFEVIY